MLVTAMFHIIIPLSIGQTILSRDPDTYYTIRQVEVMVNNFPQYNWFDPMTAYPVGKTIDWGPLFALIASSICILFGAHTFLQIYSISSLISPIISILIIPIIYLLGKEILDKNTGLAAAGLATVISLQYFISSSYTGWADHHIMEVFFTTLFFLTYLYSLNKSVWQIPLSITSGFMFFLSLITSTTTLISLVVIIGYIIVISFFREHTIIPTTISMITSIFLLVAFGFVRDPGLSLIQYSTGVVYIQIAVVIVSIITFIFVEIIKCHPRAIWLIPIGILSICISAIQFLQPVRDIWNQSINLLFGASRYTDVVSETTRWSSSGMWNSFNFSIILFICGIIILIYYRNNKTIFLLVWTLWMVFLTLLHQRFQYYLTIPLVLVSGICISECLKWDKKNYFKLIILLIAGGCIAMSVYNDINYVVNNKDRLSPEWVNTMEWIRENTLNPGIDYYGDYSGFIYPEQAYGVVSLWDYGHWITTLGHRISVANPFQQGVVETSNYFLSKNLTEANDILKKMNGKYVIIDSNMLSLMGSMSPWIGEKERGDYNDTMAYRLYYSTVPNYTLVHQEGDIKVFSKD